MKEHSQMSFLLTFPAKRNTRLHFTFYSENPACCELEMGLRASSRLQQWPAAPCGMGRPRVAGQGPAARARATTPARSRAPEAPGPAPGPRAPGIGCLPGQRGQAKAGPGRAGPMAGQGRAVGSQRPALLQHHWGRG